MQVKDISSIIEDFAPLSYQESYDNSGLIIGHPLDEVKGVLISMDCVEQVLDEAIELGFNMIASHHPIVFSGLKKLNAKNYIERVVMKAIKNDIAIYAAHTNLDNAPGGVSFRMAEKIGLTNCQVLQAKSSLLAKVVVYCPVSHADQVREAMFEAGAGDIGNYSSCSFNIEGTGTFKASESANPHVGTKGELHTEQEVRIESVVPNYKLNQVIDAMIAQHPYEEVAYDVFELKNRHSNVGSGIIGELEKETEAMELLEKLKKDLNLGGIRYTKLLKHKVKRIALCGGSGSFLLEDAIGAKADLFITGDFKYHQFFDADGKIVIADIGHYESEQYTSELIYDILMKKIPNFAIRLSKENTNPVNYL